MLGPHFYYDLIRLARNRRNHYLRCGYLLLLLVAWWVVYEKSQPFAGHLNDYARLATNFTHGLLAFQYVMIFLLTPIYLAGTIAEERGSRMLELIYQTDLSDDEILLGKFAARVVHLMYFLLLSMPMLSIITLWGGVDMPMVAMHFGLSLLLILFLGSICLWVSVTASTYAEAIVQAYLLDSAGLYCVGVAVGIGIESKAITVVSLHWLWLGIPLVAGALFIYSRARRRFARLRGAERETKPGPPPLPKPKGVRRPTPPIRKPRDVPDEALLWKEMVQSTLTLEVPDQLYWLACIVLGGGGLGFLILRGGVLNDHDGKTLGGLLSVFCMMGYAYSAAPVFAAFSLQAASSVARERERNTLDFLLMLPMDRSELLFWKWISPWIRARAVFAFFIAVPLIAMMSTVWSFHLGMLVLLAPWPGLLLVNTLGLLFSVLCRRTVTANILLVVSLFVLLLAHLAFWDSLHVLAVGYKDILDELDVVRRQPVKPSDRFVLLFAIQHGSYLVLSAIFLTSAFWFFARGKSEIRSMAG